MTVPACVRFSSEVAVMARAMPKSATLTCPLEVMSTLAGFTSRWTTPLRWANPRAAATSEVMSAARSGCRGPSARTMSARVRPSTYSMTMKYVPPASPQS
jgi:hypothetical protein